MTNNNFIDEISFNEDFLPFKNGDKIEFGGKKEVQDLIKFYLKDKKILDSKGIEISAEENADRFKINCILGNNGGGKSRLFEYFFSNVTTGSRLKYKSSLYYEEYYPKNNIILDDFFKLSGNIDHFSNVNKNILNGNINNFLIDGYDFLGKNKTINNIFSYFLKEELEENGFLNFDLEINFQLKRYLNLFEETRERLELLKWDGITGVDFNLLIETIENSSGFSGTFIESNFLNIKHLFSKNEDFFYIFLLTSGILKSIFSFVIFEESNDFGATFYSHIKFCQDFEPEGINLIERIKKIYNDLKNIKDEEGAGNKSSSKKNLLKDISEILKEIYPKINSSSLSGLNINSYKRNNVNFGINEIEYLSKHFDIDLKFKNKNFSYLSAGEKMMLIRFTNIFSEINNDLNKSYEKKILILIDEPDLHLHLDWQKKYIQKLIDVFSTLDKNIKLHFIIATHSPFIISDLPSESIIVLDGKGSDSNKTEYTKISKYKEGKKTFGANFVDIINDGFFFKDKVLMGSFAESIIGNVANLKREEIFIKSKLFDFDNKEKLSEKDEELKKDLYEKLKEIKEKLKSNNIEKQIGDDFLKDNLLYFNGKK